MMTKRQIEEFAVGYPYPTDYVEVILKKYDFDKDKANQALCKTYDEVVKEVQGYSTQMSGCESCQGDEDLYLTNDESKEAIFDEEKIGVDDTFIDLNDLDSEVTLNWKWCYDECTMKITYDGNLVALLHKGDEDIYDGVFIEQFEVLNQYKGKGYGTNIMKIILSGIKECYVLPESQSAETFWENLGFERESHQEGDVWHYLKTDEI